MSSSLNARSLGKELVTGFYFAEQVKQKSS